MRLPRALYVHVPFCARRCFYCDFAVHAARNPPTRAWLDAIGAEIALLARREGWPMPLELDTLYIGGGTPSLLGTGAMAALREVLGGHVHLLPDGEWTCEANPESFTPELARDWRAAGVSRISLGAQTFNAPALRWMGRLHGPEGPARAMLAARESGFENVSVDLIFALPARLGRDWGADLEHALALEPEHVSLYGLTAENGAPLGRRVAEGREIMAEDDEYADEYLLAHERLVAAGFEHYEVSNFARPGLRSRHNQVYWTGAPYIGLGPGAHAYSPPTRRWNPRDWDAYRRPLEQGVLPSGGEEFVDAEAAALERIWLGLRTSEGVPLGEGTAAHRTLGELWVRRGWAEITGGTLRLLPQGWLLLDSLAVEYAQAGAVFASMA